jgi:hypothetical protein
MEITFTKTDERRYEVRVWRDDGVVLRVQTPDRPAVLPHDMAHYLIDHELNFARGFWGCIAAGAVFDGMQVVAGRRPPHAPERSKEVIKTAGVQLVAAELYLSVLQNVTRAGQEHDWALVCAHLDEVWRPFREPRPPVSAAAALRVCRALRAAALQWQALPVGQSITVSWPAQPHKRMKQSARQRVRRK